MAPSRHTPKSPRDRTAFRAEKEHLSRLVTATADIVWETDRNARFVYVSPPVEGILGYTESELLGKTPFGFLDPSAVAATRAAFSRVIAERAGVVAHNSCWVHRDGHRVVLESRAVPILDASGSVTGFYGIDRDITGRIKAEAALRESEEKFRSLVEFGLEGILILSFTGTILFANSAARQTAGVPEGASLIGRNVMDFIAPASQEAVIADFSRVARSDDAS